MVFKNGFSKKFSYSLLAVNCFFFAGINSVVAGGHSLIVECEDGQEITYRHPGTLSFKNSIPLPDNFGMERDFIRYGSIKITRSSSYDDLLAHLQRIPGVKSARVEPPLLSADDKYAVEKARFTKLCEESMTLTEMISYMRDHCSILKHLHREGARFAQEELSEMRFHLGGMLMSCTEKRPASEAIPLLKEAETCFAGIQTEDARNSLSIIHYNLGTAYIHQANALDMRPGAAQNLRHAVYFFKKTREKDAKEDLPLLRANLGIALANESQQLEIPDQKIAALEEAVLLLKQSAKQDVDVAKENLEAVKAMLRIATNNTSENLTPPEDEYEQELREAAKQVVAWAEADAEKARQKRLKELQDREVTVAP